MKKLLKCLGIALLVFVAIIAFVMIKNAVDNKVISKPPITNNGGNSSGNNSGNDDVGNNNSDKPKEPEKEVYTKDESVDELIRKFNLITFDSSCNDDCLNQQELTVAVYWFGGGSETKKALINSLNMIINHPDFEKLNAQKKIRISFDSDYVKPLHGDMTYSFNFFVFQHSKETKAEVYFTGRIATKDEVTISQEDIDAVYELRKMYHS